MCLLSLLTLLELSVQFELVSNAVCKENQNQRNKLAVEWKTEQNPEEKLQIHLVVCLCSDPHPWFRAQGGDASGLNEVPLEALENRGGGAPTPRGGAALRC